MPTSQSESFLLLFSLVHSVVELVDAGVCLMISLALSPAYVISRRVEVVFVCVYVLQCSLKFNALYENGFICACISTSCSGGLMVESTCEFVWLGAVGGIV